MLPGRRRGLVLFLLFLGLGAGFATFYLWQQAHLDAARQALEQDDLDQAQAHLDLVLRFRPRHAEARLLAARTARRRDSLDEADQHLDAYEQYAKPDGAVVLERAMLSAQRGDLESAEQRLRLLLSKDGPDTTLILEALAKGYLQRFRPADAVALLTQLLERRPDDARTLLLRGQAWESLARNSNAAHYDDALRDYRRVVDLDPRADTARLGLAHALFQVGRTPEAAAHYECLRRRQPDNPALLLGLARCRSDLYDRDEARQLLDELLAGHPDDAAALLERGRLALHQGRLTDAERDLRRAVDLASRYDLEPRLSLHHCLEAQQNSDADRQCLAQLKQIETEIARVDGLIVQADGTPQDAGICFEIAASLRRLDREQDALSWFYVTVERDPRHGPAHAALAEYLERAGQQELAERHRRLSR